MEQKFQKSNDASLFALIGRAKDGEQKAFEELLTLFAPLIDSMTARFSARQSLYGDREDVRQEATLGFYQAVLRYDLEQESACFSSFAKVCIKNRLISFWRKQKRQEVTLLADNGGLMAENTPDEEGDPSAELVEWEKYQELSLLIRNNLSPYENRIWWLYLSGRTAREIGTILGKDDKSVQNAIYRIRKKLREIIRDS